MFGGHTVLTEVTRNPAVHRKQLLSKIELETREVIIHRGDKLTGYLIASHPDKICVYALSRLVRLVEGSLTSTEQDIYKLLNERHFEDLVTEVFSFATEDKSEKV